MLGQVYSIVDIETTGGSGGNRITEIAICKTNGIEIIDTYEQLIDPDTFIPHSITLLTGITNEMVASAPNFENVAPAIYDFLEGTIFVAHNVSFDYSIVKNHFDDMGISFNMKKLCTVRLSRQIFKGFASYSLGKLCAKLGIENENRHRAMGDARATTTLFHMLLKHDIEDFVAFSLNQLNKEASLPPNLPKEEFESLPQTTGVYYLLGEKMEILYVGKAKNIKQRITNHFTEKTRQKSELLRKIHHLGYEETGNELVAYLFESAEIKKHYPPYNRAQKSKSHGYFVSYYKGQDDILRVDVFNKKYNGAGIKSFTSLTLARDYLYALVDQHGLCPKYTGLERTKGSCYKGEECPICSGQLSAEEYNERVKALSEYDDKSNLIIVGSGRAEEEQAAVLVKDGEYKGFGYFPSHIAQELNALMSDITPFQHNSDTQRIIRQFLEGGMSSQYKIIEF